MSNDKSGLFMLISLSMEQPGIKDFFREDGILSESLPYFEYRHEQLVMAEHVYDTFLNRGLLIAEAQTGTGKTLAYLIPAVLSGKKTVISTGTKNLQEQVFKKDVPFLREKLGIDFKASCMKGRANYICLKKYKQFSKQGSFEFKRDVKHFSKVSDWLKKTASGDIEELTDVPENVSFFKYITSSSEHCSGQKCADFKECFITRMKERSLEADVIIINHHLFFADLVVKESSNMYVVPHYQAIVFDEAHQLEDTASSYFGIGVSNYKIEELARDTKFAMSAEKVVDDRLASSLDELVNNGSQFFMPFRDFSKGNDTAFKLSAAMNYKKEAIEQALVKLYNSFDITISHLEVMKGKKDDMQNCLHRAKAMKDELAFIMDMSDENYVYWCENRKRATFIKATPIDVSETLRETLFNKQGVIVLTSATLAADNGFTYIKERLGIPVPEEGVIQLNEPDELILPSPFDYENHALYYLPRMKNEPASPGFAGECAANMLNLILACGGRTFALFTSNKNMRAVHKLISDKIPHKTFMQGDMPKSAILKEFIEDRSSVLFATMSFWEGVDVQGDALICVIIDKLPFASPGDPLIEAKINLIRKKGGNPFFDLQVPQAIITLKQGLGRLIRKKDDYGILSILDKRLRTKGYGRKFIKSIPKARVTAKVEEVKEFLLRLEDSTKQM